ncbi:hypothetical protein E2C01_042784 [Portunus trituberculatus]|uniref:Uncharacterized protein n=1 Tax=Portunus trituberculatus TaxID=210409 RepID=A0A5B7FVQ8_PORTR|nr:hypothetical protein [Portunus trituberculatus]
MATPEYTAVRGMDTVSNNSTTHTLSPGTIVPQRHNHGYTGADCGERVDVAAEQDELKQQNDCVESLGRLRSEEWPCRHCVMFGWKRTVEYKPEH